VLKGQVVRVVTTGGGGWGDPLQRELEFVWRDVIEGRVSRASAEADYGVVFATASAGDQRGSTKRDKAAPSRYREDANLSA